MVMMIRLFIIILTLMLLLAWTPIGARLRRGAGDTPLDAQEENEERMHELYANSGSWFQNFLFTHGDELDKQALGGADPEPEDAAADGQDSDRDEDEVNNKERLEDVDDDVDEDIDRDRRNVFHYPPPVRTRPPIEDEWRPLRSPRNYHQDSYERYFPMSFQQGIWHHQQSPPPFFNIHQMGGPPAPPTPFLLPQVPRRRLFAPPPVSDNRRPNNKYAIPNRGEESILNRVPEVDEQRIPNRIPQWPPQEDGAIPNRGRPREEQDGLVPNRGDGDGPDPDAIPNRN